MKLELNKIYQGDSLEVLKTFSDESIDCCITSPPYWGLRDYGTATWIGGDKECDHKIPESERDPKNPDSGSHIARFNAEKCFRCGSKRIDSQIGLEKDPQEFVNKIITIFHEVKRILKKNGTLWLNLGDSYSTQRWSGNGAGQTMNKMEDGYRDINPEKESGLPEKNLVGIPWRVAFALQADGWYLRQDIIWAKPNPMPESVTDRCTKSHEYIFLMAKNKNYYFDNEAIKEDAITADTSSPRGSMGVLGELNSGKREPSRPAGWATGKNHSAIGWNTSDNRKKFNKTQAGGGSGVVGHSGGMKADGTKQDYMGSGKRNKRSVWQVNSHPYSEAHFATYPEDLIVPMVKAGCRAGGVVLDPFMGAGTTGLVAQKLGRNYIGIELNPAYIKIAEERLKNKPLFISDLPVVKRSA